MKKLLSLLAAVGLTATAATSVVACGSSQSDDNDNGLTQTILKNSSLGTVSAGTIMDDLVKQNRENLIFGDKGTALKTFLNYASERIMSDIAKDKDSEIKKASDANKNASAKDYINDGMWDSIKQDWTTRKSNAEDAWQKQIDDAQESDGKKRDEKLFDSMKSQFGEYIYDSNNKRVKATKYTDYKDLYISYQILNGQSSSGSLSDSLRSDIYSWANNPDGSDIKTTIINELSAQLFNKKVVLVNGSDKAEDIVDFKANNEAVANPDTDREKTWFGQMDNFINHLVSAYTTAGSYDKLNPNDQAYLNWLVNMINMTGGLKAEDAVKNQNFMVDSIEWATRENVIDSVKSNVTEWSNNLIQRLDNEYDDDFNANVKADQKTDTSNLVINAKFDITLNYGIKTLYAIPGKQKTSAVAGLFSNSQRFVANDYFNTEKPLAISEVVVKPMYTTNNPDLSQEITNHGFVNADDTKQMNQLFQFLGYFINSSIDGSFKEHKVDTSQPLQTDSSDYTWDRLLMENGLGSIIDPTTNAPFDSTFSGNVSVTKHENLLTRDSSSSDFSDILKYSVYDFIQKGSNAPSVTLSSSTAPTKFAPDDIHADAFSKITDSNLKAKATASYNVITNLVQSLNRTKTTGKSMYKVVNPDQGIIAFIAADGIHFVRVEGYQLLKNAGADAANILGDQKRLSVDNLNNKDTANAAQATYHSAELLKSELTDTANYKAVQIGSDYNDKNADLQSATGLKYSDLNNGLGNKYLQFLANSSIAKANGASNAKYGFNLNDELDKFTKADITDDNIANSSNMLSLVWSYVEEITGWNDEQMYDFIATGNSPKDNSSSNKNTLLFDALRNADGLSADDEIKFKDLYHDYITEKCLGPNSIENRTTKAIENYATSFAKADYGFTNVEWKNKDKAYDGWRPDLTFKDSDSPSNKTSFADADGSDIDNSWYSTQSENLEINKLWNPYKGFGTDANPNSSLTIKNQSKSQFRYSLTMSKFMINDHEYKGDEE